VTKHSSNKKDEIVHFGISKRIDVIAYDDRQHLYTINDLTFKSKSLCLAHDVRQRFIILFNFICVCVFFFPNLLTIFLFYSSFILIIFLQWRETYLYGIRNIFNYEVAKFRK
jgi:hypothetical protein